MSHRLAGAPISWGVCEVPGWGLQLSPDRVLSSGSSTTWATSAGSCSNRDLAVTGTEPPVDGGPALDAARSIEFLSTSAPRRERVSLT